MKCIRKGMNRVTLNVEDITSIMNDFDLQGSVLEVHCVREMH